MEITKVEIVEIAAAPENGMSMRVSTQSDTSERYEFTALAHGDAVCSWIRGLHIGETVPLSGLPFPSYNSSRRRYELGLNLDGVSNGG